jgi:glutamate-ammonia-ligase adenylyltransferase
MKPSVEDLRRVCPGVDERLLAAHLERLGEGYFTAFGAAEVAAHVRGLAVLRKDRPVELQIAWRDDQSVECTVLAFDYPSEFSLITGVLTGLGFGIVSGNVFTYAPAAPAAAARRRRRVTAPTADDLLRRRRIVDRFVGTVQTDLPPEDWQAALRAQLGLVIGLLETGTEDALREARHRVNETVAQRLSRAPAAALPLLYPMEVGVDNGGACTRLHIVSQDTPAFLYALSSALSLRGHSIEAVEISTSAGRIEDTIDILRVGGGKLEAEADLNQVKLSILLTKQFTFFLGQAPDPYAALSRFEQLLDAVLAMPERGQWLDLLSRPRALQDLARLLGASDYLWEDFIRLQYEALLPMLQPHVEGRSFSTPAAELAGRLQQALARAGTLDARRAALNEFKDRELFLIDLDAILNPAGDVRRMAAQLTALAEVIAGAALEIVRTDLLQRHGTPRTVGGLEARHAVLGLGKMGGAALGYASDIELLLLYSDNGRTDGATPVENAEFYGALIRETAHFIQAKREGIFHVDLRLRPYGKSGPWACSLESFCRYYAPGGPALSFERLALTRLRQLAGDADLGRQVERLRDELIYNARGLNLAELRDLRGRQLAEKVRPGEYNAKFSAGGLVDLEYDVQILQVMHGAENPRLRTPRIHEALEALSEAGVLEADESRQLVESYYFLRRLINGLRMLRGSALDLSLPAAGSPEYGHLARRMGYERGGPLEPEQQLLLDFETRTAVVRAFVERHFGRDSLPGPAEGNVVDLLLSESPPAALREKVLRRLGFENPERAYVNLRRLAGAGERRAAFAGLAVLGGDLLRGMPDPDMALNNWERLAGGLADPVGHYRLLLSQPRRLSILLGILSGSQFLADTLVQKPEFFDWVTDPRNLQRPKGRAETDQELAAFAAGAEAHRDWLNAVRRFRKREILRIGTRDLCLRAPVEDVVRELSFVAESVTGAVLARALAGGRHRPADVSEADLRARFCILAMGKLGGAELNYSSDIDLVGLYDDRPGGPPKAAALEALEAVLSHVHQDLAAHTEEGPAYRVDQRLRPHGRAGHLVQPLSALLAYYREDAALWEVQALLKMRPVAGSLPAGHAFLEQVRDVFGVRRSAADVAGSIENLRRKAIQGLRTPTAGGTDLKTGPGGLRDVEFLVQGLQLIHAPTRPDVLAAGTLEALTRLRAASVLDADLAAALRADYLFLRRVEHYLQILEDRQIHALPEDAASLRALARRVLGVAAGADDLTAAVKQARTRVRGAYERFLAGEGA